MAGDPIQRFKDALHQAEEAGIELANAVNLATVDEDGRPTNRMVLLKAVDDRGFVFYTNIESPKALHLARTPWASLCFWWNPLQQQVRVEGPVEIVSDDEADRYFATRARGSQVGAWASKQSAVLRTRDDLLAAVADIARRFARQPVPRPPFWSGYRVRPERIEFWLGKPDRLHERHLYTRAENGDWGMTLLQP